MDPAATVPAFDAFLHERGLRFEAVVIGGSALVLLGVITRTTFDVDVIDPSVPEDVLAVREYDANPRWPAYAKARLEGLAQELEIHVVLPT